MNTNKLESMKAEFQNAYVVLVDAMRDEHNAATELARFKSNERLLLLQETASGVIIGKNETERSASFWSGREEMYAEGLELELAYESAKTNRLTAQAQVELLRVLLRIEELAKLPVIQEFEEGER